jgi:hypothetical protein
MIFLDDWGYSVLRIIIFFIIVLFAVFVIGCTENSVQPYDIDEETATIDFDKIKHFENFSGVPNIIYYLGLDENSVTVLSENENQLTICFVADTWIDVHDRTIVSYANYVRGLEEIGYKLTLYDATISQTFALENNEYEVNLTTTIDEYKEEFKKARAGIVENIDKMQTENILFQISKKD